MSATPGQTAAKKLLSQVVAGFIVHHFGPNAGFLFPAAVALAAFGILCFFMPEARATRLNHPRLEVGGRLINTPAL